MLKPWFQDGLLISKGNTKTSKYIFGISLPNVIYIIPIYVLSDTYQFVTDKYSHCQNCKDKLCRNNLPK